MRVMYQNKVIKLDDQNTLGIGGEATVIREGSLAFKIYHKADRMKIQKLKDFFKKNFKFSHNVIAPVDLVNDIRGNGIGFTMNAISGCTDFMTLSNKKHRMQNQITTNNVIKVFSQTKNVLDNDIHPQKLVVGDFNDLNLLYNPQFVPYFIDVDSWQFDQYPCPVGTDVFIDPRLIGIDLSKKPYFSRESDWYSFAVMLFKSLLFVHPYGGIHKTITNMLHRMQQKISIFDKSVIYPKVGLPLDTLSDQLLDYFSKIFVNGQRIDLPVNIIQTQNFVECPQCKIYFSTTRTKCPACQKTVTQQMPRVVITQPQTVTKGKCFVRTIFEGELILFTKVVKGKLVVVTYDGKVTKLRIFGPPDEEYVLWEGTEKFLKYDFFDRYLTVCDHNTVAIFECKNNTLYKLSKTTTKSYNESAIFSCSDDFLYRLTDNYMMKGEIVNGHLVENIVTATMDNQTWFSVGSKDLGFGFFRVFDKYQYFVFSSKGRYEVTLNPIPVGKVIEFDVKFSVTSLLLLFKTLDKGRTYSHYYIIDNQGKILESKSEESISSVLLKDIFGKEFAGSAIIHSTDDGIVIEKHGKTELKDATADYVDSDCLLAFYKNGMLVISAKKIQYLELM